MTTDEVLESPLSGPLDDGDLAKPGESLAAPLYSVEDDVPRFRIKDIVSARNRIREALHDEWLGETVTPTMLEDELYPAISNCLPKIRQKVLEETLTLHLLNRPISRKLWERLAVRLSGNIPQLKVELLSTATKLTKFQWAALETMQGEFHRTKLGNRGVIFTYRVRTGTMAGEYFRQFMPSGYMPVYGDMLGLGKARWIKHPRLYMGMNLLAYLCPSESPKTLYFSKFHGTAFCKKINKFYARGRTQECIYGFSHACWNCPRGLLAIGTDHCKYATHRYAWERRDCPNGHEGWYDRNWPASSLCRRCRESLVGE